MNDLRAEVRRFIVDSFLFGQPDERLTDAASFLDAGLIDSTGVLELIAFLERCYGIVVGDDDIVPSNLDSVDRVARFVDRKRALS